MSFAGTDYLPFLALALALIPFVPGRARPLFALALSYGFYASRVPWHLAVLVASTALDYGVGWALGGTKRLGARRALLGLSLVGNLALLVSCRFEGGVGHALGVSFYTFQSLGYTLDVYRRTLKPCRDPVAFALYVAFFPQLLAGPIERARSLLPQLERLQPAGLVSLDRGVPLILWGLWKKLVLADRARPELYEAVMEPEGLGTLGMAIVGMGLNVVLFLDFSAYTDIARGSARLFGVELSRNFDRPYLATSVGDFTRRWHMSLIRWITDYVWAPLLRGRPQGARLLAVNALVLVLFALWHAARWDFLLLAGLLGVCITFEQWGRVRRIRRGGKRERGAPGLLAGWALTMAAWGFFGLSIMTPDPGAFGRAVLELGAWRMPSLEELVRVLPLLGLFAAGLLVQWVTLRFPVEQRWYAGPGALRAALLVGAAFLIARVQAPGVQDFVYFRF